MESLLGIARKRLLSKGVVCVCLLELLVWFAMLATIGALMQFYAKYMELRPDALALFLPVTGFGIFAFVRLVKTLPDLALLLARWKEQHSDVVLQHRLFPLAVGYGCFAGALYYGNRFCTTFHQNFTSETPITAMKFVSVAVVLLTIADLTILGSLQYYTPTNEQPVLEGDTT